MNRVKEITVDDTEIINDSEKDSMLPANDMSPLDYLNLNMPHSLFLRPVSV